MRRFVMVLLCSYSLNGFASKAPKTHENEYRLGARVRKEVVNAGFGHYTHKVIKIVSPVEGGILGAIGLQEGDAIGKVCYENEHDRIVTCRRTRTLASFYKTIMKAKYYQNVEVKYRPKGEKKFIKKKVPL